MKSSRVLVAIVALLCLAAMSSAAVIDITGANYSSVAGWRTAASGMGLTYVGGGSADALAVYYAQYSSSDLIAAMTNPAIAIVSANLVYSRDYWANAGPTVQATMSVSEPLYNYLSDTGSDYTTAAHMQLIGGNRGAVVLTGARICSQAETAIGGAYYGTQSVDVTAILQDWKNGATNFSYSLGMACTIEEHLSNGAFLPYLEVTTGPATPEPVTMVLLAVGGIATLLRRRSA